MCVCVSVCVCVSCCGNGVAADSASVVAITSDQEAAKKAAQLAKSHALTACHLREVEVWLQRRWVVFDFRLHSAHHACSLSCLDDIPCLVFVCTYAWFSVVRPSPE